MCTPEPAPRLLWWDVRRCPSALETDAIQVTPPCHAPCHASSTTPLSHTTPFFYLQIETDAILDMADLLVNSGLAAAQHVKVLWLAAANAAAFRSLHACSGQRRAAVVWCLPKVAGSTGLRRRHRLLRIPRLRAVAYVACQRSGCWRSVVKCGSPVTSISAT